MELLIQPADVCADEVRKDDVGNWNERQEAVKDTPSTCLLCYLAGRVARQEARDDAHRTVLHTREHVVLPTAHRMCLHVRTTTARLMQSYRPAYPRLQRFLTTV